MDINKIFNLFDKDPSPSDIPLKDKTINIDNIVDYQNHPLFWVGIFKKLIYNHELFNIKILNDFKQKNKNVKLNNNSEFKKAGDSLVYNGAFNWLSKIDLNNPNHQDALLFYNDVILIGYIRDSIEYFKELEEYEKCATLKNIQIFLEKSLT